MNHQQQTEVLARLIQFARDNEWQVRHAAENTYCPDCATGGDDWRDQKEHHPGCQYVSMMSEAEQLLELLKEGTVK